MFIFGRCRVPSEPGAATAYGIDWSRDATPIVDYSGRFSSVTALIDVDLPRYEHAEVVVSAPEAGPGNWAGGASCVLADGVFWLAYRIRRPLNSGRGVGVVVAKSVDGVNFMMAGPGGGYCCTGCVSGCGYNPSASGCASDGGSQYCDTTIPMNAY